MIRKLRNLAAVVLIGMLSIVVSCSNSSNVSNKQEDTLKGKITVLTDKKYASQLELAADNFKKIHSKVNIDIKVENIYDNLEKLKSEKDIDLINIEDQYVQSSMNKLPEFFLDVTDEVNSYKTKIRKSKIDNLSYKDKIYGYPWSTSPKIILYRRDVFEKEGINVDDIKTWNDYIDVGKKIKKEMNKKLIVNIKNGNNDLYLILANELNTSYFKNDKIDFTSKEWLTILDTVKSLYSEGLIYDAKSYDDATNSITKEDTVSLIADPLYINNLMKKVPGDKDKWGVMKLPAFEPGGNRDSSVGGANLMISKETDSSNIAKEFAKFVLTDDYTQMENVETQGGFPVFTDIYNLTEFNNVVGYFNSKLWDMLSLSEGGASGIEYNKQFPEVRKIVENDLSVENIKSKDSKAILEELQKECEEIVNTSVKIGR